MPGCGGCRQSCKKAERKTWLCPGGETEWVGNNKEEKKKEQLWFVTGEVLLFVWCIFLLLTPLPSTIQCLISARSSGPPFSFQEALCVLE